MPPKNQVPEWVQRHEVQVWKALLGEYMAHGLLQNLSNTEWEALAYRMYHIYGARTKYLFRTRQNMLDMIFPHYMQIVQPIQLPPQPLAMENQPMSWVDSLDDPERYRWLEGVVKIQGNYIGMTPSPTIPGWNDNEYNIQYNTKQMYVAGIGNLAEDEDEELRQIQFSNKLLKNRMRRELLRKSSCHPRDSPYGRVLPRDPDDPTSGFGTMGFPIFQ